MRIQFFDVSDQLVFIGHAAEVETDHFIRTKRWFFAGPQTNEQTGNDRTIGLNLDAVLVAAEQVAAAKHVLEEAKENLDRPAMREYQRDDLGRNVRQVCGDAQGAVAVHTARASSILATRCVRIAFDADHANGMVHTTFARAHLHRLIAEDVTDGRLVAI